MSGHSYPQEARDRVNNFDTHKLLEFLRSVPERDVRHIMAVYPPPQGFRPNQKSTYAELLKRFAHRVAHAATKVSDKDWLIMERLWAAWLSANLGDEEYVDSCLEEWRETVQELFEPEGDDKEREAPRVDPDTVTEEYMECSIQLFKKLTTLTERNRCAKEDLDVAAAFGPFVLSQEFSNAYSSARTREDVNRSTEFARLPSRFKDLVERVSRHADQIHSFDLTLTALSESVERQSRELEDEKERTKKDRSRISNLGRISEDQVSLLSHANDTIESLISKQRETERDIQAIQASIHELSKTGELDNALKKMRDTHASIEVLRNEIAPLKQGLEAQSRKANELSDAISKLSIRPPKKGVPTELSKGDIAHTAEPSSPISIAKPIASGEPLADVESLLTALSAAFSSLGLKPAAGLQLAREVIAALICNQTPFFRGVFANVLAETTAHVLSNGITFVCEVSEQNAPAISIIELAELSNSNTDEDAIPTLQLINANRVPFESYGLWILDRWLNTYLGRKGSQVDCFALATLDDGPAGLPLVGAILEAGPIIDTDLLQWKLRPKSEGDMLGHLISKGSFSDSVATIRESTSESSDDLSDLIRALSIPSNWAGRLRYTLGHLGTLNTEDTGASALQSLAAYWIVPRLLALGLSGPEIFKATDDGFLDSDRADTRLSDLASQAR